MRKFCIFCGEKPVDKNKEHIIPQWLIKYTGDPNRITMLGKRNGKDLRITWLNFVFPACEQCNYEFSKIESEVRTILIKLDLEKSLTHNESDLFLDWLDKVRIGMWLGHATLKNRNFEPNFFINSRIGTKDRILLMYKLNGNNNGIGIIGTDTGVFEHTPCCFSLIINNMAFFNYSTEFLLGKNIGFPYADYHYSGESHRLHVERFYPGNYKVEYPIIDGKILKPAVKLYQSILKGTHGLKRPFGGSGKKYYDKNCLTFINHSIKSRIYLSNEQENVHDFWTRNKKYTFKFPEKFDREFISPALARMTLEHQNQALIQSIDKYRPVSVEEEVIVEKYYGSLLADNQEKIHELANLLDPLYITI